MKNILKRVVCFVFLATVILSDIGQLTACKRDNSGKGEYTYNTQSTTLATNWNPHSWETNADGAVLDYITSPFVSVVPLDTELGTYQWAYEMATAITDVTSTHTDDLTKYGVTLPKDTPLSTVSEGYVFEIKLNPDAKWENGEGITADDYIYSMKQLLSPSMKNYRANLYISGESALAGAFAYYSSQTGSESFEGAFDKVGLYKVDEYRINYVCQTPIELNYFLTSLTDTWLVYEKLYEAGKREEAGLTVTNYGTSKDTTMSYGAYRLVSYEDAKQMVLVRNDNWYGFQKDDNGELYSVTPFKVDGENLVQYQTTRIVIDVMDEATAKQSFFKGELIEYSPTADELSSYVTSDRLYRADETYTMSFFFNANVDKLKTLDRSGSNKNSVVLSNDNFRKALSLAINRNDYVTVTQAWVPAYALMNGLYHYDIYNDPASSYRASEEAMQAICNLYGVEWGEDKTYKTLKEAYSSINGYNLNEAKTLMKKACDELTASGLYKKGEDIRIQIAWAKGALTSDDNAQLTKLNQYVNAALSGSGFGRITFEAVGNIDDRYGDVPQGKYAVGYGAWGGAAFYPFRNFQTYMDPDKYGVNELGSWDPRTEKLTLTVNGKAVTMTWQEWSNSMIGTGRFAGEDLETKLKITALLEEKYLGLYYRIPVASTTSCTLLSYKVNEYTDQYNIMYGFGGFRLISYDFDDYEWREYVKGEGGTLGY